ncbi:hypothetical protein KY348_03630 [Candidatus Woesearchaeota archaeon]|nr:hypothetical protein [Candidatus Woesearchaeota archaeon]
MKEELIKLGLTEGEAKVYLALLRLGSSTVGPIIKKAKVANSKVYSILQRLIEKGLASYVLKEKTKYFNAVPPTRLSDYLDKQEQELQQNRTILKALIPGLRKAGIPDVEQEAEIFEGFKGVKTAYERLLENNTRKDQLLFFYIYDKEHFKLQNLFYKQAFHYYKKLGIKLRGVGTREYQKSKDFEKPPSFMDLRFVDFPLPSMVDIYQDKVLITSWTEKPLAYLIHSKEISKNFKKYFETVWKSAKK